MNKRIFTMAAIVIGCFALVSMTLIKLVEQEPWVVPAKYVKMENPFANAADDENIGRILYAKHCQSCHGKKGLGDGKKAATLDTPSGDFSTAEFQAQTDGALFYKTREGRDDMPSFKNKISDEEDQWRVICYLRTF